jgi:phosphate-selective porin OprO/OprP
MGLQGIARRGSRRILTWGLVAFSLATTATAQDSPPVDRPAAAPASRESSLEERFRAMEATNRRLQEQLNALSKKDADKEAINRRLQDQLTTLSKKYDDLSRQVQPPPGDGAAGAGTTAGGGGSAPAGEGGSRITQRTTPGRPASTTPSADSAAGRANAIGLKAKYDNDRLGYVIQSDDQEFELRVNALLQVDSRIYAQQDKASALSDFNIPRARIYFSGRMTKPIEYQVSFQRSLNNFDLLNAYVNFHYDDRLQVRLGRYRAPYTYEWAKLSNFDLPTPERSLFALNFGPNRMVGLMGWGFLFDQRLEYAVGIFNGSRNSYQDFNNSKDVMSFIDYRPFGSTDSALKFFSVGGSLDAGQENNPLTPAVLRTSTNASANGINSPAGDNLVAVPFLAFNNNVRERGSRGLWELHATYFYKGLSLLGAWDSGHNDFSQTTAGASPVHLPVSGYFVQVAYLLTGETRERLGFVAPLHPFDLRHGRLGPGAIEVQARFSELSVGNQVFTGGLADPNLWSNRAELVDVGLNWYLNKFVKVYFDWEHATFAQPVLVMPGLRASTNDLFWLRLQLYF